MNQITEKIEWTFFYNVYDRYQAEIIKSILSQEEIPVLEKSKGSGAYTEIVLGRSSVGIDIYVPNNQLAEAQNIINTFQMPFDDIEESDSNISGRVIENQSGKWQKRWLFIILMIPGLAGLIYYIIATMRSVYQVLTN